MKILRISLLMAFAMALILGSLMTIETESAIEIDPETTINAEDSNTSAESFWEQIQGFFIKIINGVVDFILAPFKAMMSIWEAWGDTLGEWWSPILATFVLVVIVMLIRGYTAVDRVFDMFQ